MSEETHEPEQAVAISESEVPTRITLNPSTSLDLSSFSEEERAALLTDYTRGVLDVSRRAHELHVDVATLGVPIGEADEGALVTAGGEDCSRSLIVRKKRLVGALGGDRIQLQAGTYPHERITAAFADEVVIEAAPGTTPSATRSSTPTASRPR